MKKLFSVVVLLFVLLFHLTAFANEKVLTKEDFIKHENVVLAGFKILADTDNKLEIKNIDMGTWFWNVKKSQSIRKNLSKSAEFIRKHGGLIDIKFNDHENLEKDIKLMTEREGFIESFSYELYTGDNKYVVRLDLRWSKAGNYFLLIDADYKIIKKEMLDYADEKIIEVLDAAYNKDYDKFVLNFTDELKSCYTEEKLNRLDLPKTEKIERIYMALGNSTKPKTKEENSLKVSYYVTYRENESYKLDVIVEKIKGKYILTKFNTEYLSDKLKNEQDILVDKFLQAFFNNNQVDALNYFSVDDANKEKLSNLISVGYEFFKNEKYAYKERGISYSIPSRPNVVNMKNLKDAFKFIELPVNITNYTYKLVFKSGKNCVLTVRFVDTQENLKITNLNFNINGML